MNAPAHRRLAALVALAAASALLAACADEASSPTDIPTRASAGAPTAIATAVASPAPPAVIDDAIEAVADRDVPALAGLISPREIACSSAAGVGGPPPCGSAPEGTIVSVFPFDTCEREWQANFDLFAERWFTLVGQLYAVVRIETPATPDELPDGGYGIIYENIDPAIETAHALVVTENGVVSADSLCGGPPEAFLADGPPFNGPEVIEEGPAFD